MPTEQSPNENDAEPASGEDSFPGRVADHRGSHEPLRLGDAAVNTQPEAVPEIEPGITSPPPVVDEVDVWLTKWQVAEDHLQVVLDEIVTWDLVPMDQKWIARLFAGRRAVPLQLDIYANATRNVDATDLNRLGGTVVRIDQISIRYLPSTEPLEAGLVPDRGAAVVHAVSSIWPTQPHYGSVSGWIVRIRRL